MDKQKEIQIRLQEKRTLVKLYNDVYSFKIKTNRNPENYEIIDKMLSVLEIQERVVSEELKELNF